MRALRDLAREHLGKGYSKLKTKQELIDALKKVPGALKALAREAGERPKAKLEAAKGVPAKIVRFARRALPRALARAPKAAPEREPAKAAPPSEQHAAEPLVEGFFVARVAGEQEVRRHHLTEEVAKPTAEASNGHGYDEKLGELPHSYGDDSVVLLPRDPMTLFFLWDFASRTREEAALGLPDPRAVIRVYEGEKLLREIDFAFESHCYYIHGLPAGLGYRVEAFFVGSDGRAHRVGRPSNSVALPPSGPSGDLAVRFLRIPWGLPLVHLRQALLDGRAAAGERKGPHEHLAVPRFELPSSASWQVPLGPQLSIAPGVAGWVPPASGRPY
ncbi:MAG: DUF4912 domain-containing protein [Myxococcales bacterium]|nr:DUF4912 domain-containing protein [Myxococcales bacterium]